MILYTVRRNALSILVRTQQVIVVKKKEKKETSLAKGQSDFPALLVNDPVSEGSITLRILLRENRAFSSKKKKATLSKVFSSSCISPDGSHDNASSSKMFPSFSFIEERSTTSKSLENCLEYRETIFKRY